MLSQEYEVEMKTGFLSLLKMKSPGIDHIHGFPLYRAVKAETALYFIQIPI